jgi:hypothetical protein
MMDEVEHRAEQFDRWIENSVAHSLLARWLRICDRWLDFLIQCQGLAEIFESVTLKVESMTAVSRFPESGKSESDAGISHVESGPIGRKRTQVRKTLCFKHICRPDRTGDLSAP